MNILLWVLQVGLAWMCIAGGIYQVFKIEELKKGVAAMRTLPRGLWGFLGVFGCLAGVGLIVPGALGIVPELSAWAAIAVAAHSLLITGFYLYFGDRSPMAFSGAMAAAAAFVAYGRFVLAPL